MTIKEIKNEKGTLKIITEGDAENPRNWDNLSKMICFHKRYCLGDRHDYNSGDYNNWNEVARAIQKDYDIAIMFPLYLYDHGNITIDTSPFSCSWDSGQVGWVFVTKDDIRKEYNRKRVTKKYIKKAKEILMNEVKTYDAYISGEVFKCIIKNKEGKTIYTCGGFYGIDFIKKIEEHIPEEYRKFVKKIA